jgi:serine/threonine-protein kinase
MRSFVDTHAAVWPVAVGDVVAGKYRVERLIAAGGMGLVVQALHLDLGRPVAIKFMRTMLSGNGEALERFLREGRAVAMLRGEHVARVLDVGRGEDGLPFLVLEYLEGQDLAAVAERRAPLAVAEVCWYLLQACEGLAEAHRAGIVHRDLKPANLFLTSGADGMPCIKVLDFGISKTRCGSDPALTTPRGLMGSPVYMAPEQMRAPETVDARADVWALGSIAFELCTGRAPFDADSLSAVCARVLEARPPPLSLPAAAAATGFERVVMRCLEKDPQRRYASVAELAEALAPFAPPFAREHAVRAARMLGVMPKATCESSMAPIVLGPPTLPPSSLHGGSPRRRRGALIACALLAAAGIAGVVLRGAPGPSSPHVSRREAVAAHAAAVEPPDHLASRQRSPSPSPSPSPAPAPSPSLAAPAPPAISSARVGSPPKRTAPAPRPSGPQRAGASTARPRTPVRPPALRPYRDRGPSAAPRPSPRPDLYDVRR